MTGWKKYLRTILAGSLLFGGAVTASLVVEVLPVSAGTLTVTDCSGSPTDTGSLPYAVANSSPGDTITFALSPPCSTIAPASTITISHDLTLTGPGAGALAVSGGGAIEVFAVDLGVTAAISGLTIEYGSSSSGGGIGNSGNLAVTDVTLSGDGANAGGGGIYNTGTLNVVDSNLSNDDSYYDGGGGIDNNGTMYVTNTTFYNDSDYYGGGGIQSNTSATIAGSTFTGNSTYSNGGGIDNYGSLDVTNSTFSGNGGYFGGGGIYNLYNQLTVTNSTFSGNTSAYPGGDINNNGPMIIGASLVVGSGNGDCSGVSGQTDLGYNLDDDGSCGFDAATDLSANPSADLDPSGLQNNGGPTQTIALEPGSTAIHGVTDASFCPATDQRGAPRTTPCDIGAFDTNVAGPFTDVVVTGSQTHDGGATITGDQFPAPGVTISGTIGCSTVNGGSNILPTLSIGSYTVDGTNCSGLTPSADPIYYQGATDGYAVVPDSSTTALTTDVASQNYGEEGATTFTVTVHTGNGELLPTTDSATVDVGSASCVATLTPDAGGGSGGCMIGNAALAIGSYTASVTYGGDAEVSGSGPATTPFTVNPSTTTVGDVSPNTGLNTAMTPVTITGTGFTGATAVDVGGVPATGVTVVNDSTITATLPTAVSAGAQDVTVTSTGGTSAINPADTFTYTVEASPTVVTCTTNCSTSVSTPLDNTTVAVSGPVTANATFSVVTNTSSLYCGAGYTYASPLTTLSGTGFNADANLTVKLSEGGVPSVAGAKVCYQGTGSPVTLATCGTPKVAACVKSLTESNGNAVAKVLVPAGDPRMKLVTPEATLTAFTPLKGDPGSPVTITGTNLEQITTVVIGGATAPIIQQTATSLVVDVPQNAVKGLITLDADSGIVTSTAKFKVK